MTDGIVTRCDVGHYLWSGPISMVESRGERCYKCGGPMFPVKTFDRAKTNAVAALLDDLPEGAAFGCFIF